MQALALKYRPKNFDELIGQDIVVRSLKSALSNERLAHAYLFSGLRGSGKTSSARIFAKSLLCENLQDGNPCELCQNCLDANAGKCVDIVEIDAASNRKIDDIRDLIEQTKYAPSAKYKIFIIDEVHMLTKEAFNAFLKTLEEPPNYVKFILATTDPLKLPQTILSRTQHFKFSQISNNLIAKHLEDILTKEKIFYEKEAIELLAKNSSGSLRDSLTQLDQAIVYSDFSLTKDNILKMLGYLSSQNIEDIFASIKIKNRQKLLEYTKELQSYDTNLILDEIIEYLKEDFLSNTNNFSFELHQRFFKILNEAKYYLSINSDSYFTLLMTFFLMMQADEKLDLKENEIKKEISIQALQNLLPSKTKLENKIDNYEEFLSILRQKDEILWQIFTKEIEFLSFKDSILYLKSSAKQDSRQLLRSSSKIINSALKQSYGQNAKINVEVVKTNSFLDKIDELMEKEKKNSSFDLEQNLKIMKDEIVKIDNNEVLFDELSRLFGEPKIIKK